MSHQSLPTARPPVCWYFRDRLGHRFGPYFETRDTQEIVRILNTYRVSQYFEPSQPSLWGRPKPATDFVMEDSDYHPIYPGDWLQASKQAYFADRARFYKGRYGAHVFRQGPVSGIHKRRFRNALRSPHFGRKVHDTGHGCREDAEPMIRVKLRVRVYAWDDFVFRNKEKSWKSFRRTQWK